MAHPGGDESETKVNLAAKALSASGSEQSVEAGKEDEGDNADGNKVQKLPYPKSVFFILATELCERFCFYGMRAVLVLYLKGLLESESAATETYHIFTFACYGISILGAFISDSYLGKYRTILYLGIIYCFGQTILATFSGVHVSLTTGRAMSCFGLFLVAVGTGGIKPCVSAFGADQFKLPEQENQLEGYFSIFYACINIGSLVSTIVTPIFRSEFHCFGRTSCYPLAFGVPAGLMILAMVVYVAGTPFYNKTHPKTKVFVLIFGLIFLALGRKIKYGCCRRRPQKRSGQLAAKPIASLELLSDTDNGGTDTEDESDLKKNQDPGAYPDHWLDYASDKYNNEQIRDTKILVQVLWLFLPIPIFWALYDQQGSKWTLQAEKMDGDVGAFAIKPDQMQSINTVLVLLFIPLFNKVVYPLCAKINFLQKALERIVSGGVCISLAFVVSAILEAFLVSSYPMPINHNAGYVQLINMGSDPVSLKLARLDDSGGKPLELKVPAFGQIIPKDGMKMGSYNISLADKEGEAPFTIDLVKGQVLPVIYDADMKPPWHSVSDASPKADDNYAAVNKSSNIKPYVRFFLSGVWSQNGTNEDIVLQHKSCKTCTYKFKYGNQNYSDYRSTRTKLVDIGSYKLTYGEKEVPIKDLYFRSGGSYIITLKGSPPTGRLLIVVPENRVHILWQIPQYILVTIAEILFSITLLDFSYREAPRTMKSVLQAAWLTTVAMGNIFIVIITKITESIEHNGVEIHPWAEYVFYAILMAVTTALFAYMATIYKPAGPVLEEEGYVTNKPTLIELSLSQKELKNN